MEPKANNFKITLNGHEITKNDFKMDCDFKSEASENNPPYLPVMEAEFTIKFSWWQMMKVRWLKFKIKYFSKETTYTVKVSNNDIKGKNNDT